MPQRVVAQECKGTPPTAASRRCHVGRPLAIVNRATSERVGAALTQLRQEASVRYGRLRGRTARGSTRWAKSHVRSRTWRTVAAYDCTPSCAVSLRLAA